VQAVENNVLSDVGEAFAQKLGTADMAGARKWYAVYTSPRHEKRVTEHFELRAIQCFLPLYRIVRRWKNGCRVSLALPLFSNYVFVHVSRPERIRVLQVPGVLSIVGTGREPIPIGASEIELLREGIDHLRNAEPHPYLMVGERARIRAGPLAGIEGIVVRRKNELRIVLTVEAIMKSFSIEVDADGVEPVGALARNEHPPTCAKNSL